MKGDNILPTPGPGKLNKGLAITKTKGLKVGTSFSRLATAGISQLVDYIII